VQIKYFGTDKFEVKTNNTTIILGAEVAIGDFKLPGPGEYEKSGVFIEGISKNGNTIYVINVEEMRLCYLGRISHDLREDEAKEIGAVDILFTPLGEEGSTNLNQSLKIISRIDPRIVIPMLYSDLAAFKKSEGITEDGIDVLKIKKIDLPEDERRNVILNASHSK